MSWREKENGNHTRWREDEFHDKSSYVHAPKSKGISPRKFYACNTELPGKEKLKRTQRVVKENLLKKEKRSVTEEGELKRSAYKTVTSLRTFPLQSQAFAHWRTLMKDYMNDPNWTEEPLVSNIPSEEGAGVSPTTSSVSSDAPSSGSSLSSGMSNEEPKRLQRDQGQSPAQSVRKKQYQAEFLRERDLVFLRSPSFEFGCPLWSMEPRIFASEKSGTGKRKYIVGHLGRFLDQYWRKSDPQHRFYYELIPENRPCRLYLDLEYSKHSNPEITDDEAEALLDELFVELQLEFQQKLGIDNLDRSHVVDLDSSTESKFSRHWIVHLPNNQLFSHTRAMGHFMQQFISRVANEQSTEELDRKGRPLLQKYFLVAASPSKSAQDDTTPKRVCVIDNGVYTRNRLFRLMGSSKFGRPPSAALRIAERNKFGFPGGFGNQSFYVPAMTTCAKPVNEQEETTLGNSSPLDTLDSEVRDFAAATDWSHHAEALARTLVVPLNLFKVSCNLLPFEEEQYTESEKSKKSSGRNVSTTTSGSLSVGTSPYPLIDQYVYEHLASRGGVQGAIRAWSLSELPPYDEQNANGTAVPTYLTFQMSRNRWCECIGRPHRSNNTVWTVDLRLWQCVQSCHDPECRALSFRGTPVPLPQHLREKVADQIFEEQLVSLDEDQLILKAKSAQQRQQEERDEESFEAALASLSI